MLCLMQTPNPLRKVKRLKTHPSPKVSCPVFVPYAFLRVRASFCPVVVLPPPLPRNPNRNDRGGAIALLIPPISLLLFACGDFFPSFLSLSLSLFLWASNWAQGSWIGFYRLKWYKDP